MATSTTTRLGLLKYGAGTDAWPGRDPHNAERDLLDARTVRYDSGTFAARPAFGIAGRVYLATNTGDWYLDTGAAWVQVAIGSLAEYLKLSTGGTIAGALTLGSTLNLQDNQIIRPQLRDYAETVNTVGNSGTSTTFDCSVANVHTVTLSANCTFTLSNPPASGQAGTLALIITNGTGARTITWPASVKWSEGEAPDVSGAANAVSVVTLLTTTAGATWYGFLGGRAFA